MEMDNEDIKDIPKKYLGTWFRYKPKEADTWSTCYGEAFQVDCTDAGKYYFKARISSTTEKRSWINSFTHDFDFSVPPVGVLNFFNTVVYTFRFPARQWKKAMCQENYVIQEPLATITSFIQNHYEPPKKAITCFAWGVKTIEQLYNNKYTPYEEAIAQLKKGTYIARALNEDFFITNSHYNDSILLWRKSYPIAEIYDTHINYLVPEFKQEITDYFNRRT